MKKKTLRQTRKFLTQSGSCQACFKFLSGAAAQRAKCNHLFPLCFLVFTSDVLEFRWCQCLDVIFILHKRVCPSVRLRVELLRKVIPKPCLYVRKRWHPLTIWNYVIWGTGAEADQHHVSCIWTLSIDSFQFYRVDFESIDLSIT